ncbi:hypothetical protein Hanom_Chr06g00532151 [Helianthus anomalus]
MASLTLSLSRIKTYQQYHRHPTIILSPSFPATVLPSPSNSHLISTFSGLKSTTASTPRTPTRRQFFSMCRHGDACSLLRSWV